MPPSSLRGIVYDADDINAAIAIYETADPEVRKRRLQRFHKDRRKPLPSRDSTGHGTAVASILCGEPEDGFEGGTAPDSVYLMLVRWNENRTGFASAVEATAELADSLGVPWVVSFSVVDESRFFGDGSGSIERWIDSYLDTREGRLGSAIVVSAGNARQHPHSHGARSDSGPIRLHLSFPNGRQTTNDVRLLVIYRDTTATCSLSVRKVNPRYQVGPIPPKAYVARGNKLGAVWIYHDTHDTTNYEEDPVTGGPYPTEFNYPPKEVRYGVIYLETWIDTTVTNPIAGMTDTIIDTISPAEGEWEVALTGPNVGRWDLYVTSEVNALAVVDPAFHDDYHTLPDPASSRQAIVVGCKNGRETWTPCEALFPGDPPDKHTYCEVSFFSGLGPPGATADSLAKPDIYAPGAWSKVARAASMVHDTDVATLPLERGFLDEDCDTNYVFARGASYATPYVAGIVARLLERRPLLKPEEVRDVLRHRLGVIRHGGVPDSVDVNRIDVQLGPALDSLERWLQPHDES